MRTFFSASSGSMPALVVAIATALAFGACSLFSAPARPNVLLISIDTLRADRLGCYGHDVPTSPNIDALARSAVLFETVVAAAPSTLPSHASVFTGLHPARHGALYTRAWPLPEARTTLAEILQTAGYRTASVNDGGQMDAKLGVAQGFDDYQTLPGQAEASRFSRTVDAALEWFDTRKGEQEKPWFLFLHTYETHHPYASHRRFLEAVGDRYQGPLPDIIGKELLEDINAGKMAINDEDRRHILAAYDAGVLSMDESMGHLLEGLRKRGLLDNTLIVLTSDHGEELGEHGRMGWHSHALWDELLLVPLVLAFPGGEHGGRRIAQPVRGVDVLPTILEVLGLDPPGPLDGRSAMPLVRGEPDEPRPAISQMDSAAPRLPTSLRTEHGKLILGAGSRLPRLFNLKSDPEEAHDLAASRPQVAAAQVEQLEQLVERIPEQVAESSPASIDETLREKLRSLGYAEPGAPAKP